ncbi:MAG: hypothetical protein ACYDHH_17895 [Solirubrobacteraceae bacterium]
MIGVYEPAWVILEDGSERPVSLLTVGSELHGLGALLVHERCHTERRTDGHTP